MTLDEQLNILQAAKRGEKIEWGFRSDNGSRWFTVNPNDSGHFNFGGYEYRIADPYAKLKAAAQDPMKQIRYCDEYGCTDWYNSGGIWEFDKPLSCYEIRDKPKPKKVVKYLCYSVYNALVWREDGSKDPCSWWKRRPAFDKECEVEDE